MKLMFAPRPALSVTVVEKVVRKLKAVSGEKLVTGAADVTLICACDGPAGAGDGLVELPLQAVRASGTNVTTARRTPSKPMDCLLSRSPKVVEFSYSNKN